MADKVSIERCAKELVGAAEAAVILGVESPQITRWRKADMMPRPVERLKATFVWLRDDIYEMRDAREAGTWEGRSR